jgi:hypothetical protein
MIVDPGGGDVGMAKPLLHLDDVGLVIECVGGSRRPERMHADLEPELRGIGPHQFVDAVGRNRHVEAACAVVADRPEQCAIFVLAMLGGVDIFMDQRNRRSDANCLP